MGKVLSSIRSPYDGTWLQLSQQENDGETYIKCNILLLYVLEHGSEISDIYYNIKILDIYDIYVIFDIYQKFDI